MTALVHALLAQGFAAQKAGQLHEARQCYQKLLQLDPGNPEASQLLGLVSRRLGDDVSAEALFRQSLAAKPSQPHVWNNLGNLLFATRRMAEAGEAFRQALALNPAYADAHYNQARVLLRTARPGDAAQSLTRAWQLTPSPSPSMWQLKAEIEAEVGDLNAAEQTLRAALAASPSGAQLWHNLAVMLQRSRRYDEALQAHRQARALGLEAADARYNVGNTLQCLGRIEEALAEYEAALQLDPLHTLALHDLARLRWRLGDPAFDAELRRAMQAAPHSAAAPGMLGQLLWQAGRFEQAVPCFREALRRDPASAPFHDGLGSCLVRLGEVQAGLTSQHHAVQLAATDADILCNLATSLLVAGRIDNALDAAQRACHQAPLHQRALALRDLARRLLGQAVAIGDGPRAAVRQINLPPPPGWSRMQDFNDALAQELRRLHAADRQQPIDQSLRGGTQTFGDLFASASPLVTALRQLCAEAVTRTVEAMPVGAAPTSHEAYFSRRPAEPQAWRFDSAWSSRLTQGGFHADHVHPHGWMSSVYYVQVPACVANAEAREGWLRFGVPDFPIPGVTADELVLHQVQPVAGGLVLFPSLMWHGTNPFAAAAERLTIAFDVVPA